jgi:hypothetical protein
MLQIPDRRFASLISHPPDEKLALPLLAFMVQILDVDGLGFSAPDETFTASLLQNIYVSTRQTGNYY